MSHGPEVVLALGGGAARGLAHVGILRVLGEAGIRVRAVAGTSVGAIVGGLYCGDALDAWEAYIRKLDAGGLLRLLDVSVSGSGLLRGARIVDKLHDFLDRRTIDELELPFLAVAAELESGREVRIQEGETVHAIRASMAIPGVFQPVEVDGEWLVDGGVACPVPVAAARTLAPGLPCIAVDLNNADKAFGGELLDAMDQSEEHRKLSRLERVFQRMRGHEKGKAPGMLSSVSDSVTHLEHRLSRFQLAAEQPEALLEPAVYGVGLFDFHRAAPIIAAGEECARHALDDGLLRRIGA